MIAEKEQLRTKIKKLKYKIQKEQKVLSSLSQDRKRLDSFQTINQSCTVDQTLAQIIKKINFFFSLKGMNLIDWINSLPYECQNQINDLVQGLEKMSVRLNSEQKGVLENFLEDEVGEHATIKSIENMAHKYGIRAGSFQKLI